MLFSAHRPRQDTPGRGWRPWALVRSAALAGTMLASGLAGAAVTLQPASAAVAPAMGPVNPTTNFPSWYGDANGQRLEVCLDDPKCIGTTQGLTAPAGEAFYFNATAKLDTPAGKSLLVLSTEAAFSGPGVGRESAFNRTRLRINTSKTGTFTVTWPYGQKSFTVTKVSPLQDEIRETIDLGCIAAPPDNTCNDGIAPDFNEVTNSLQPFLKWDPAVVPAAPPGFIGDNLTPHKVTGSPTGHNFFRIDGPDIGGPGVNSVQTDLFVVQGELAGPLVSTPGKVAFGGQAVGTSTTQSVTLTNIGAAPLTVTGATIDPASPNPTDFAVTGTTCAAPLARDASCTVTVSATPSATGARSASLSVTHNQLRSPLQIPLKGFGRVPGTAPTVSLSPASLDFGTVHEGAESAPQRVTIANTGTAPLNITKVALTGANLKDFRLTADCTDQTLDPGLSCPADIVFAPLHGGALTASLSITDDAATSPQVVPLTGTGQPGIVAVGPVDPATHFPTYYQDSAGLALDNCLAGPPNCLAAATALVPPAGESFYFDATSRLDMPNGGRLGLVLATEAAYAGPGTGQEITFNRIRFFATKGLVPGATYKVTHPYGVDTFEALPDGSLKRTTGTQDVGCLPPAAGGGLTTPCDFTLLMASRIGPFLTWDTYGTPDPALPAGYIGDAATRHKVVGSPYNTNIFRVEGPLVNANPKGTPVDACPTLPAAAKADPNYSPENCLETDLFVVQGKVHTP